jgi:NAD(P)-dependent dehydrogenase (short-subunit alcohol dehydrogenase family)
MPDPDLADRVVAVTGAGGRLGRRLGRRLLERGATVAALDRPGPLDDLAWQGDAHAVSFDATDEESVAGAFAEVQDRAGRLDALVHTVGMWAGAPLLETPQADFERQVRLNLTSAFLCFREATRQMQDGDALDGDSPGKRLVAFASGQGADRGAPQQYGYSAAKAGVVRLVEGAAAELDGVTATAIAPSTILFGDDSGQAGVPAGRLVSLVEHVLSPAGDAVDGATLRAYGSAR